MDRCAIAYAYRKQGLSCSQSVACAFADRVDLERFFRILDERF